MRAKVRVCSVNPPVVEIPTAGCNVAPVQHMTAYPVGPKGSYPADGSDEDNDYAKWSPGGEFKLSIVNPALSNKIKEGDEFYVLFIPVKKDAPAEAAPAVAENPTTAQ